MSPEDVPDGLVAAAIGALNGADGCMCCELTPEEVVRIVLASALPGVTEAG